ncbi:hypothetical protein [Tropicimonas marinistellae]|uniref:hypothetical protein n=1 Tax=Tropicimonas marinistellae TaxID=1739787 RepID=UPI0008339038|nr:hypothetical protein [Tropicimonas marinistellae]
MGRGTKATGPGGDRDQRLKQALKANLQRRKAQARSRAADGTDGERAGAADDATPRRVATDPETGRETGQDG